MSQLTRPAVAPVGLEDWRRWTALVVVCLAALIINVDNTILNVALPTLVRDLHATTSELQWIVDSYAMVFAGLLLVGGSLADRFGRKRFFLIGLTVFAAGSVGAAFSGSVHLLIAWRAVMGAGAALTIPASLSIINDVFRDPGERARAIGAWAGTTGLGIAIGPIAGGLLLAQFWWGSIFLVNVPIVIAGLVGPLLLVPDSKNPAADRPTRGRRPVDRRSGLLLWAIIEAPTQGLDLGWRGRRRGWPASPCSAVSSPGRPAAAIRCSTGFFSERRFSTALAAECLGVFGLFGALFLQTQFLQFDLGLSPLQAGIRILPIAAVLVVGCPAVTGRRPPHRDQVHGGRGLMAIAGGLWQISAVSGSRRPTATSFPGLLLIGFGAGLLLPTATNSVIGSVPRATRDRLGHQRGGAPGRRRARRRRDRQRDADPLPGPHDRGARRPARADRCRIHDPRLSRRSTGGVGERRGYRCTAGPRRADGLHERERGGAGCGGDRLPGRRGPGAGGPPVATSP